VDELIQYIQQGRIIDAMNEFYASDVRMQENNNAPTVGLAANIERERQFLANVKEWKSFDVLAKASSDDVSFVENRLEFVATNGAIVRMQQVSVARWRDGRIIEERFYYDSAAK
jgi:ketosteroid isomerase-like protein